MKRNDPKKIPLLMFSNYTLRKKFVVTLLALLIVPLLAVSAIVTGSIYRNDYQKTCESELKILSQVHTGLKNFTSDLQYISINVLSDSQTQSLIKKYRDPETTSREKQILALNFSLLPLMDSRDFISTVAIYDKSGIIYQYGDRTEQHDLRFYNSVVSLKGKPYWTSAYTPETSGYGTSRAALISLMRVINDLNEFEKMLAVERITVNESYICSLYSAMNTDTSVMLVVNDRGEIVSSTDKNMLGESLLQEEYFGDLFASESGIFDRGDSVVFYSTQSSPSWSLVLVEQRSALVSGTQVVTTMMMISVVLTIIFGAVFLVVQNRSIIKPVERLSHEAQLFREGNFSIQTITDSADEVGQLNRSLISMSEYIKNLVEQEYKSKLSQREMELEYLQSQVNPHFLYNTLDAIRWMAVTRGQGEIAEQVEALSSVFRHSLNSGEKYTTLQNELDNLWAYVLIQKNRFGDNIDFKVDVAPGLNECRMIKLLLQPLVENAIKHGLEEKLEPGTVRVEIDEWQGKLRCRVFDDGVGADECEIRKYIAGDSSRASFALKNIHERLKLEYGEEYGLGFFSLFGKGTMVQILLPIVKDMEEIV